MNNQKFRFPVIIGEELELLDFKKHRADWYRQGEQVIFVVGLQKSQWGNQHYINLAIWVNALGEAQFPCVQECHIQCRLENLSPDKANALAGALDEEDGWKMDAEERRDIIKFCLGNAEFLFFRELNTFEKKEICEWQTGIRLCHREKAFGYMQQVSPAW